MKSTQDFFQNKVLAKDSSFYYSFLFLPKDKRLALTTKYKFCRIIDDIVDSDLTHEIAAKKLIWWQEEIDRMYKGNAAHPIAKDLNLIIEKYHLPKVYFDELIQGMAMDLQYQGYKTFDDLKLYCYRVASVVGVLSATVFGVSNTNTLEYAKKLGMSFQIINIIRDIGEDARRKRIYIPEEDLRAFGVAPEEILNLQIENTQGFNRLLNKYTTLAKSYYASAIEALPKEDRVAQRTGLIMAKIYLELLNQIVSSDFSVINQRIAIAPLYKFYLALSGWWQEKQLCAQLS